MKWKWFPVNLRWKPGLEMILAENSAHKTVRKIKFLLIKNRKTKNKNPTTSPTSMIYIVVIFKAMLPLSSPVGNN